MLRGFQSRLLALVLLLLLGIQIVTLVVVRDVSRTRIAEQSSEALAAVSKSLHNWMGGTVRWLADTSAIFAADYGFRSAIASGDRATIVSAIGNAQRRTGADAVVVLDLERNVLAATGGEAGAFDYPALLDAAERNGRAVANIPLGERLMQFVVLPVRAPDVLAWIGVGVEVGGAAAAELKSQSAIPVEVSFLVEERDGWRTLGSSLDPARRRLLDLTVNGAAGPCHGGAADGRPLATRFGDERHAMSGTALTTPAGAPRACMVVQRSLDQALAPYQPLFRFLGWLSLAGFVLGAAAASGIARSMTRPIRRLADAAAVIKGGDYPRPVAVSGPTEVAHLAQSFNLMVEGIAERERLIFEQANFDAVTGLPNRLHFETLLGQRVRQDGAASLFMIRLRNLDEIANTLGHELCDRVVVACAARIAHVQLAGDVLARVDFDRLGLLVADAGGRSDVLVASRIHDLFEAPIAVRELNVDLLVDVGLARFPQHGTVPRELLRRAEIALGNARPGTLTHATYDPERDPYKPERLTLISELRGAMEDGSLALHYQPKVDAASGRVTGAEALMRWTSPLRGFVAPDDFIPVVERTGFIAHLTRWALARAAADSGHLRDAGHALRIAVNISARDLLDARLPGNVLGILARHGLAPATLTLEITESGLIEQPELALESLNELAAVGVGIAIDDFGTGYSSLAYLADMPADELKIDKRFASNIVADPKAQSIVQNAVQLAHSFGMRVCAEGVEDAAAAELLRTLGCDTMQGWHFGKPMAIAAFEQRLAAEPAATDPKNPLAARMKAARAILAGVGLLFTAGSAAAAGAAAALQLEPLRGYLDVGLAAAVAPDNALESGIGKLRYGEDGRGLDVEPVLSEAHLVGAAAFGSAWRLHLDLKYDDRQRHPVDVAEAYLDWRSAPGRSGWRARARVGTFLPPFSLENRALGWSSPVTLSSSALNAWIGEELRINGGEARALLDRGAWRFSAAGGIYLANDAAGTLLAFRGFASHDRELALFDRQRIPAFQANLINPRGPFRRQSLYFEPLDEIDGNPGYYAGLTARHAGGRRLEVYVYDNYADPESFDRSTGQYGWRTRFVVAGGQAPLPWGLLATSQVMVGETAMGGRARGDGPRGMDMDFFTGYGLLTRAFHSTTLALRGEYFEIRDKSEMKRGYDNAESGYVLTATLSRLVGERAKLFLETQYIEHERPVRVRAGEPARFDEWLLRLNLRVFL